MLTFCSCPWKYFKIQCELLASSKHSCTIAFTLKDSISSPQVMTRMHLPAFLKLNEQTGLSIAQLSISGYLR